MYIKLQNNNKRTQKVKIPMQKLLCNRSATIERRHQLQALKDILVALEGCELSITQLAYKSNWNQTLLKSKVNSLFEACLLTVKEDDDSRIKVYYGLSDRGYDLLRRMRFGREA